METVNRLSKYLKTYQEKYPDCWKQFDSFRCDRGVSLANWPNWCYCPLAGAYAIISKGREIDPFSIPDVGVLGALAAWRVSQGIYRFDQTVFDSLVSTEINDLPVEIFYRLPEWCVYIEANCYIDFLKCKIFGFFCHLEYDINHTSTELRLVLDTEKGLQIIPLHLKISLLDSLTAAYETSFKHLNITLPLHNIADHVSDLSPLISLVLYLCSENQDTTSNNFPVLPGNRFPIPKKVKSGFRLFPPDKASFYEVGFNVGNNLRSIISGQSGTHNGPRPHIRRAHWHTFLTGPRSSEERYRLLKWLPPLPINVDSSEEIIPVIKKNS